MRFSTRSNYGSLLGVRNFILTGMRFEELSGYRWVTVVGVLDSYLFAKLSVRLTQTTYLSFKLFCSNLSSKRIHMFVLLPLAYHNASIMATVVLDLRLHCLDLRLHSICSKRINVPKGYPSLSLQSDNECLYAIQNILIGCKMSALQILCTWLSLIARSLFSIDLAQSSVKRSHGVVALDHTEAQPFPVY